MYQIVGKFTCIVISVIRDFTVKLTQYEIILFYGSLVKYT
jgi:hypothetical protein